MSASVSALWDDAPSGRESIHGSPLSFWAVDAARSDEGRVFSLNRERANMKNIVHQACLELR